MSKRKQSQAWKNAERQVAAALRGVRISRGDNFAREDVDVKVKDFPRLRIDAKYRTKHAHHTFMAEILRKYVSRAGQEPVLVTKHHNQQGAFATIRLKFLGEMLDMLRAQNSTLKDFAKEPHVKLVRRAYRAFRKGLKK